MRPPNARREDIRRGEVWLVRFDPTVGAEINKTRPAVVVSDDSLGILPLRIVVPLTEWKDRYASRVWFTRILATDENGLGKESGADALQVKSVSEDRFVERWGALTGEQIEQITAAIALCIGLEI